MSLTWVGGVCAAFLLCGFLSGWYRGLLKMLVSVLILAVSLAAVWFAEPYVRTFLDENTGIRSRISEGCEEFAAEKLRDAMQNGSMYLSDGVNSGAGSLVKTLGLPELLAEQLEKTEAVAEAAENMAADGTQMFAARVGEALAEIALRCLSFILTFMLVSILIRVLVFAVNLFSMIPVVSGINRLAGALLGSAEFLVLLWIVMTAVTLICNLQTGQKALELIHGDTIADTLYKWNPIIRFFK